MSFFIVQGPNSNFYKEIWGSALNYKGTGHELIGNRMQVRVVRVVFGLILPLVHETIIKGNACRIPNYTCNAKKIEGK